MQRVRPVKASHSLLCALNGIPAYPRQLTYALRREILALHCKSMIPAHLPSSQDLHFSNTAYGFPRALSGPFAGRCYCRVPILPGSLGVPSHALYPLHRFKVLSNCCAYDTADFCKLQAVFSERSYFRSVRCMTLAAGSVRTNPVSSFMTCV